MAYFYGALRKEVGYPDFHPGDCVTRAHIAGIIYLAETKHAELVELKKRLQSVGIEANEQQLAALSSFSGES